MSQSSDLGRTARAHASDLSEQAQAAAKQEAIAQADQAKHAAADKITQAANAAEAASAELDPSSPQAQAVQQVADRIEEVAMKLRTADVRQIASDATDVARRHPLLFIGGAAIAGFAAARFLKARDPEATRNYSAQAADPWADRGQATDHSTPMAQVNGDTAHG